MGLPPGSRKLAWPVFLAALFFLPFPSQQKDTAPPPRPPREDFLARPAAQGKSAPVSPVPAPAAASGQSLSALPRWFVLIDPGHGGTDSGAMLSEKLPEKDFTLTLARRLRAELQNRGIAAQLLRDGDGDPALEQRALTANTQRAGLYIGLHASLAGSGVKVYTAMLPTPNPFPTREELEAAKKHGAFLPWNTVQTSQIERSRVLAIAIATQLKERDLPGAVLTAAMRPLSSLTMPAVVIEVSPPAAGGSAERLTANAYQQSVVQSIAGAINALHGRTEEPR